MAEELQHLIERIQREAVDTGAQKASELVAQAKAQAAGLIQSAEQQAQALIQKAEQDAQQYTQRSQQTLNQAARDVLIGVGQGVESIFSRLVTEGVQQAMSPEAMRDLLVKMMESYAGSGQVEVLVNPKDQEKLLAHVKAALAERLHKGLTVRGDERMGQGFQVSMDGGRVKHQFTPEAIAEALANFLRPALAEIVYDAARRSGGAPA